MLVTDGDSATNGDTATDVAVASLPVDSMLRDFVKLTNKGSFSAQVTLSVKGAIIMGKLIAYKTYMDRITTTIRDPANIIAPQSRSPPEPGDDDQPRRDAEMVACEMDAIRVRVTESGEGTTNPRMIHLESAQILDVATGRFIPMQNTLWRGRLEAVDGFTLGRA